MILKSIILKSWATVSYNRRFFDIENAACIIYHRYNKISHGVISHTIDIWYETESIFHLCADGDL